MKTYIAPVHQAYLPPQAMDYESSAPPCGAPTSHSSVLLLAVLTVAVLALSSMYAKVVAFTSSAGSTMLGSTEVTTGGQPMARAGEVSYALVKPVDILPLPHIEVSVDGHLITPSTGPSIKMGLSTPEEPNTLKLDGQAVYADGTVDTNETVEFSLVQNAAADEFLHNGGTVSPDGFVTASTTCVLEGIDVKASLPLTSETMKIQICWLEPGEPDPIVLK